VLAAALFGLVRGNGYDWGGLLTYAAYLLAYVLLPGVVALAWAERRPVGWSGLLALALPAGFALEALGFLGAAAAGHEDALRGETGEVGLQVLRLLARVGTVHRVHRGVRGRGGQGGRCGDRREQGKNQREREGPSGTLPLAISPA
jgi:hypothetical protein